MEIPRALMAVLALSAALAASGVSGFVADAKASGLVAESIGRAGLRGVDVAP